MMYPQFPGNPYPYPYMPQQSMMYPMGMMGMKPSLLQSMKYSLNQLSMSSTIRTAQKTLYTANQIRPVLHNATTAFRVVKAVKQFDFDDLDEEIDQSINQESEVFENMLPQEKA